jgi:transcriptional regulator with XRE-family HTH domain
MAKKQVIPRFKAPRLRPTFIRQWRLKKEMTLEQVGEVVGLSHAQIGRIERGLQPYNQELLEALAELFGTDPASLLMRDPTDPEGIWSIWDQAKPGTQRDMIVDLAKTVLKTGT